MILYKGGATQEEIIKAGRDYLLKCGKLECIDDYLYLEDDGSVSSVGIYDSRISGFSSVDEALEDEVPMRIQDGRSTIVYTIDEYEELEEALRDAKYKHDAMMRAIALDLNQIICTRDEDEAKRLLNVLYDSVRG